MSKFEFSKHTSKEERKRIIDYYNSKRSNKSNNKKKKKKKIKNKSIGRKKWLLNLAINKSIEQINLNNKWENIFIKLLNYNLIEYKYQYPIILTDKNYAVVDFYLPNYNLIIEIDGYHHFTKKGIIRDKIRTKRLLKLGYIIIRYTNSEVENKFKWVQSDLINTLIDIEGVHPTVGFGKK